MRSLYKPRKNVMNITELFTLHTGLHDVGIGADALAAGAKRLACAIVDRACIAARRDGRRGARI